MNVTSRTRPVVSSPRRGVVSSLLGLTLLLSLGIGILALPGTTNENRVM